MASTLRFFSCALAFLSLSSCYAFQPVLFWRHKSLVERLQPAPFPPSQTRCIVAVDSSRRQGKHHLFQSGELGELPELSIILNFKYCSGCRWGMRSFWMAQELLTTFEDEHRLAAITLTPMRPPTPGGEFSVQSYNSINGDLDSLWRLKDNGRFPDIKELKRIVRDVVNPTLSLGHSDKGGRLLDEGGESNRTFDTQAVGIEGEKSCSKSSSRTNERSTQVEIHMSAHPSVGTALNAVPNVSISYCTTSRLLLRAAWLAQELISVATEDIASVTLTPIRPPSKGGSLVVSLDGQVVWDLAAQGRFPEVSDLKQLITTRTLL